MKVKPLTLFCTATLVILAGAIPAAAGQWSFGVGFGYPGYPAYEYLGYSSAPPPMYTGPTDRRLYIRHR